MGFLREGGVRPEHCKHRETVESQVVVGCIAHYLREDARCFELKSKPQHFLGRLQEY